MFPDPKPPRRQRDRKLLTQLHLARGECALCQTGFQLQLHHKRRRSQGGDDTPENLVWLCLACHARLHAGNLTAREIALLEAASVVDHL